VPQCTSLDFVADRGTVGFMPVFREVENREEEEGFELTEAGDWARHDAYKVSHGGPPVKSNEALSGVQLRFPAGTLSTPEIQAQSCQAMLPPFLLFEVIEPSGTVSGSRLWYQSGRWLS
jgi:hypothetical protein